MPAYYVKNFLIWHININDLSLLVKFYVKICQDKKTCYKKNFIV